MCALVAFGAGIVVGIVFTLVAGMMLGAGRASREEERKG
jgi:xanthosine utilization system XapX-like protein